MAWLPYFRTACLCLSLLFMPVLAVSAKPNSVESRVSLEFQDAPLAVILQALADYQQLNLVVMDSVQGKLTIRLDDIPWQQALSVVLKAGNLEMEREGSVMIVLSRQESEVRREQNKQQQQQQVAEVPLTTFHYQVNYADVTELVKILNGQQGNLLSERGSVIADIRSNSVIICDLAVVIPAIKSFIQQIDRLQPQVQLTAHIVTIGDESLEELGVRWGLGGGTESSGGGVNGQLNIHLPLTNPAGMVGFQVARLNGRLLGLELSALEAENSVEIIASPRLMTANKQTASIRQGTEIPYEVSSGSSGATSIEFKQAVLGLEVTPRIFPGGQLELTLNISQNMPGKSLKKGDGGEILTIDTQEIKTQVFVSDGETIVLGGIFQQTRLSGKEQVPVLGRIPLLGGLFQRDSQKQSKRELVIFITPTIVISPERISANKIENG
ncbi:type IV pilus secretin PilQ [Pragia fontium]|uniref:type IV pilus secretin PilQ n=1 Tax=Pragia fontium TaxID=82985 RepID=UPI0008FFA0B2|nr:type IV pilus secretin PilQ [Pragia fontium]